jgi:hypothetical protein
MGEPFIFRWCRFFDYKNNLALNIRDLFENSILLSIDEGRHLVLPDDMIVDIIAIAQIPSTRFEKYSTMTRNDSTWRQPSPGGTTRRF